MHSLPEDLRKLVDKALFTIDTVGMSASNVYRLEGLENGKNAYLKIQKYNGLETLLREKEIMEWLNGKIPVPEVLYYSKKDDYEYLLMSLIEGKNLADRSFQDSREKACDMVCELARGLRALHKLDIEGCIFNRNLDFVLKDVSLRISAGLIDEENVQEENMGRTPDDIYNELISKRPVREDLVFTHGDFCLPNIILNKDRINGFIDLGRAGIADRYQDIALAVRSLKYNNETGYQGLEKIFFEEYGLQDVDWDKINYFILLDELY